MQAEVERGWEIGWRSERRPEITITIQRVSKAAWDIFKRHHYLSSEIHPASQCWIGLVAGVPVVFASFLRFRHAQRKAWWRNSRLVVLPDYQGVGIGEAFCCAVSAMYRTLGQVSVTTSSPALIASRARSTSWKMIRTPSIRVRKGDKKFVGLLGDKRKTASFEFKGAADFDGARASGLI